MPLLPPGVNEHFPHDDAGGADLPQLTPLFRQYVDLKAQYPHAILLYRLGDFYETFGPDALRASELLGLTLTSRTCGSDYKVAMAGLPHHASARYIKRLVEAGETIAICEQMEDAALAKGLVERAVTRVITAGTLVEDEYLSAESHNFLCTIAGSPSAPRTGFASGHGNWGFAVVEPSGGRADCFEVECGYGQLIEQALRHRPAELLLPISVRRDPAFASAYSAALAGAHGPALHTYESSWRGQEAADYLLRALGAQSLGQFGLEGMSEAQAALASSMRYLAEAFKAGQIRLSPRHSPPDGNLFLDRRSIAHLDLFGDSHASGLYQSINRCTSAPARRELKRWLMSPSAEVDEIVQRQDALGILMQDAAYSDELGQALEGIQDLERIAQRVSLGQANPKELRAVADSLPPLRDLKSLLLRGGCRKLSFLGEGIPDFGSLYLELNSLLSLDPPLRLADGGVIRDGADELADQLRSVAKGGQDWFAQFEARERERTGIRSLKVRRTDAFGWFIEVGKGSLDLVPGTYQRRQTLVNTERFTTPELSERESLSQSADSRLLARERQLFDQLMACASAEAGRLASAARLAAQAGVLHGLSVCAAELDWVRSETATSQELLIEGGKHPVVEQSVGARYFTPNDCAMSTEATQVMLITGPNMGGKSTYLRMVAIVAVLNQICGWVPAKRAVLPVFRRIYTRVGAQDRIGAGQSTFMVEMVETAEILNTCIPGSLVILDEVGRGTSTYDGISIAKAVLEHLHEHSARPITLFATHFFELTDLEGILPRLGNFQVEVARNMDPVTGEARFAFLYRVIPGSANDSYGIEVAALAGLPPGVVARARQILLGLEEAQREARERARKAVQMGLWG